MVFGLFKRRDEERVVALYRQIVAQARQPSFYEDLGVPDTVEGRFEMIVLHTGLVVSRLGAGSTADRDFGRRVAEHFFSDMDRTLREMGVGDLTVPKKMKKIAGAFYGRVGAYQEAAAAGEPALAAALERNVYDGKAPAGAAAGLARYVAEANRRLAGTDTADVAAGRFAFPPAASGEPAGTRDSGQE